MTIDTRQIFSDRVRILLGYLFIAFSVISIAGTQISLTLLCLVWFGNMAMEKRWLLVRTPLDAALLFLVIAFVLATVFSLKPLASLKNLKNPLLMLVVFALATTFNERKHWERAVDLFIVTATLVSLIGLFSTRFLHGQKVMGLQSLTMTWGAMCVIICTMTLSQWLFGAADKKRWWYLAAFAVQFVAMMFSYVRGAWVGFGAALLFLILIKDRRLIWPIIVIAVIFFLAAPEPLRHRMENVTNLSVGSTQVRLTQWTNAIKIFLDHPITGVGWIDLAEIHKQYAPAGADLRYEAYWIGHFHSNYVMFLVCFGLVGFIALLYFLYRLFTSLWAIRKKIPPESAKAAAWILGAFAACIGFWINGFFDWTFGDAEPVTLFWLVIGLSFSVPVWIDKNKEEL